MSVSVTVAALWLSESSVGLVSSQVVCKQAWLNSMTRPQQWPLLLSSEYVVHHKEHQEKHTDGCVRSSYSDGILCREMPFNEKLPFSLTQALVALYVLVLGEKWEGS